MLAHMAPASGDKSGLRTGCRDSASRGARSRAARAALPALAVILGLTLAAPAPGEPAQPGGADAAELRRALEDHAARLHWNLEHVDVEPIVAEALRKLELRYPREKVEQWMRSQANQRYMEFAPITARPDSSARYRLPYPVWIPRYVSQGTGDEPTHNTRESWNAVDFAMPIGTPVLAAREGTVARVIDGFSGGGYGSEDLSKQNTVMILHGDGTYAIYTHLQPGVAVSEGERVRRGQRIARSGTSGAPGPHLHFEVRRRLRTGQVESVPIRFAQKGLGVFVPEEGRYYGMPPEPNATLRVSVNGRLLPPDQVLPLERDASVQLRVELETADGRRVDVTRHAKTRYVPMTPWSVDVDERGLVRGVPAEGFAVWDVFEIASVAVFHGRPRDATRAIGKAEFKLVDCPPARCKSAWVTPEHPPFMGDEAKQRR